MLAGDFTAAEERLRGGYEAYELAGENGLRSTTAALLARALLAQSRHEEAEQFTLESEELAEPDDVLTHIVWRGVRARILAARGELDDAERLAREAVVLSESTDLVNFRADALTDLAAVLEMRRPLRRRPPPPLADALQLYEEKGNVVAADAASARLDTLAAV